MKQLIVLAAVIGLSLVGGVWIDRAHGPAMTGAMIAFMFIALLALGVVATTRRP